MAALADLGAMAVAALAALLSIGSYLLIRAIANGLPDVHIGFIHLNFRGWFESAVRPVERWLVAASNTMWNDVGWLWHVMASVFSTIFGEVVAAISHVGDQIAHIVTQVVPDAVALAGVNTQRFVEAQFGVVAHQIVIGAGQIGNAVSHVVGDAVSTANRYADYQLTVARRYADGLEHDAERFATGAVNDLSVTIGKQIAHLSHTVAADYTSALDAARSDAAGALATARGLISQAKTEAENVAQADATRVQDLLQKAIDATNGTVSRLTGTVAADLTAAERYAQGQVAQGVADVTAQLQQTASQLGASIAAASAAATAGVAGAIQTAQQDANTALGSAEQALGGALAGVYGDLVGKAQAFNGDLSGIEGLLAGAITASIAGVAARVATLEECSVGVCATSRNPFSSLLKDALGLTELAGVGAFLTQVINDPAAAIRQDASIISGAVSGGEHLLDQLLAL
jgi:hypothetical protein